MYIDIVLNLDILLDELVRQFSLLATMCRSTMRNISTKRLKAFGILAAGLLWSLVAPSPAQADYEKGLDAFNQRLYEEALPYLEDAARNGVPRGQYLLGRIYADALGVEEDKSEAIYWLTCAGSSDDGSAMSARRLKDRLLRSFPAAERKAADRSAASCPRALTVDGQESGFDLFGYGDTRGFMQDVRGNGVVSLFLLPGEATLAAGRETASFLGAKQVAYAIDTTKDPGNDILYMMVVFFSWFLLYKLVKGAYVLWQKFSEVAIVIEVRNDGRSSLPRRKYGDHENA
jgi:hypothetical protein